MVPTNKDQCGRPPCTDKSRQGGIAGQIAPELRASIRQGRLTPGDPSARQPRPRRRPPGLAGCRGEAYEQLVAEGFLISRVGAGTQVAPVVAPLTTARPPASGPEPSTPPLRAPSHLAGPRPFPGSAGWPRSRHVLTTLPADALDYGDPGGVPDLRDELAGYLGRVRRPTCAPDNLVIVGGVAQGLSLALQALAQGPAAVRLAVEDPNEPRASFPCSGGRAPTSSPSRGRPGARRRGPAGRARADAVLLTPAHQYPTGVVLSPARRAALIEWAAGRARLLEDDYDAEFRFDRDPVGCLQGLAPDRVSCRQRQQGPGPRAAARLGGGAPALAESVRQARGELDLGSPVLDQYALAHFLRPAATTGTCAGCAGSIGGAGTPSSRPWPSTCPR